MSTFAIWGVDQVLCSRWRFPGDYATFSASNWAGDSCSGMIAKTDPDDYALMDFSLHAQPSEFWSQFPGFDVEREVVPQVVEALESWNKGIDNLLSWVPQGAWPKGPSSSTDFNFAVIAYLYEDLMKFGGHSAIKTLSSLLVIEETTAKERIREARKRKLLSSPGKGVRGTSYSTSKAKKLLEEEGVISA